MTLGPLTVTVSCPAVVGIDDEFLVTIIITRAEEVSGLALEMGNPPGQWEVLSIQRHGPDRIETELGVLLFDRWDFRIQPHSLGKLELGTVPIRYRRGEELGDEALVLPNVEVRPTSPATEPPSAAAAPPTKSWIPQALIWAGGVLLAVTLIYGIISFARLKRSPPPKEP